MDVMMHKRGIFMTDFPSDSTCHSLPHHTCDLMGKIQDAVG